jgi:hypothetical protein
MSFAFAAIWSLISLLLVSFLLGITEAGREGAFVDLVSRTACTALAYSIVLFAILRIHEPDTSIRHVLALRPPSFLAVVFGLAVGVALALPADWLDQVLDAHYPRSPAETEVLDRLLSVSTVGKRVTLVLTVVLLQPVLTELFFHGALFTPLRRTRRVESIIVATAAFETLGVDPRAMIVLLVPTVVFAWIRGATGSIFPSMLARIAFYGVGVVPMAFGHEAPRPTKALLAASTAAALVALFGLGFLSRRDARVRSAQLADGR